jgi:hypothetical protein
VRNYTLSIARATLDSSSFHLKVISSFDKGRSLAIALLLAALAVFCMKVIRCVHIAVFTSLSVGQIPFKTEVLRLASYIVVDTYRSLFV